MTVEQAEKLCIKAHKGQYRKAKEITKANYAILDIDHYYENNVILNDGSRAYIQEDRYFLQKPYHIHPFAVADMMTTDEEKIVALLHDIVEDTTATIKSNIGIPSNMSTIEFDRQVELLTKKEFTAINALTKKDNEGYFKYLTRVVSNELAIKVKIADIIHNISDNPTEKQKEKYYKGIKFLLSRLK